MYSLYPGVRLTFDLDLLSQPAAEKTNLLTYFYKHCMHRLTAPLMANTTEERISKGVCVRLTNKRRV